MGVTPLTLLGWGVMMMVVEEEEVVVVEHLVVVVEVMVTTTTLSVGGLSASAGRAVVDQWSLVAGV